MIRNLILCGALAATGIFAADVQKPLYDRLGGEPAVKAVTSDFVDRILLDDRVNTWFGHASSTPENRAAYKVKLAEFICVGTGGPCKYTGRDMATAHKGRGVTEAAFGAVVEDLVATLDKFKVPAKEKGEVLTILGGLKPQIVGH